MDIRINIIRETDEYADTSYIGKYTDTTSPWVICRHCGQYLHHAERYDRILAEMEYDQQSFGYNEEDESVWTAFETAIDRIKDRIHDCQTYHREYNYFEPYAGGETPGTMNYQEYGLSDYSLMEAYNNGYWHYEYVRADADIIGKNTVVSSDGVGGVESDIDQSHIISEELNSLRQNIKNDIGLEFDDETWKSLCNGIK